MELCVSCWNPQQACMLLFLKYFLFNLYSIFINSFLFMIVSFNKKYFRNNLIFYSFLFMIVKSNERYFKNNFIFYLKLKKLNNIN